MLKFGKFGLNNLVAMLFHHMSIAKAPDRDPYEHNIYQDTKIWVNKEVIKHI